MNYLDIAVAEAHTLFAEPDLVIIDMRDELSQRQGRLEGALTHSDSVIQGVLRKRRSNPPVLVYCYHGNQSRDLCSFLGQFGLNRVYNLEGGWAAWQKHRMAPPSVDPLRLNNWLWSHGFDSADPNSRVDNGMTALMLAALQGKADLVAGLLAAGADVKAVNDDEHTALWFACVSGECDLVRSLLDAGSDIDARNVNGVTCAIYAASTGKLEILQLLVEAGADLSLRTLDSYDALDSAATVDVLRFLRRRLRAA